MEENFMKREFKLYITDIITSIEKIQTYTKDIVTYEDFKKKDIVVDAVLNNLLIIGEACSQIPPEIKNNHSKIEWRQIIDFRNVAIHKYHSVNTKIIWSLIQDKLPNLKIQMKELIKN